MADPSGFPNKFKNNFLNILIIVFAAATIYLAYSFVTRMTAVPPAFKRKDFVSDTNSFRRTLPRPGQTLQIDVKNGCGARGVADRFTEYLRTNGFDVVETGNFTTSDIKTTMVIDRAGNMKNARTIANALGVSEKYVIEQINKDFLLDATVVIGADYQSLYPFRESNK